MLKYQQYSYLLLLLLQRVKHTSVCSPYIKTDLNKEKFSIHQEAVRFTLILIHLVLRL